MNFTLKCDKHLTVCFKNIKHGFIYLFIFLGEKHFIIKNYFLSFKNNQLTIEPIITFVWLFFLHLIFLFSLLLSQPFFFLIYILLREFFIYFFSLFSFSRIFVIFHEFFMFRDLIYLLNISK